MRAALKVLPSAELRSASPFRVPLSGEVVVIPYRIYAPEPSPDRQRALLPIQRAMVDVTLAEDHRRISEPHVGNPYTRRLAVSFGRASAAHELFTGRLGELPVEW